MPDIAAALIVAAQVASAGVGGWAAVRGLGRCYLGAKARRLGRLHLAVSARLHESQRQLERQQERGDGLREISEASALAAQLFGGIGAAADRQQMPLEDSQHADGGSIP